MFVNNLNIKVDKLKIKIKLRYIKRSLIQFDTKIKDKLGYALTVVLLLGFHKNFIC